jgi:WD40 repeat protein
VATHERVNVFKELPDTISALAFSPRGDKLAAGGALGLFRVWDLASGRELAAPSTEKVVEIPAIDFSPDGRFVAIPQGKSLALFDLTNGVVSSSLSTDTRSEISALRFSADDQWLALGTSSGEVEIVDRMRHRRWKLLMGHTKAVLALGFSTDGRRLLSGSADQTVRIWNLADGFETTVLRAHTNSVSALAISTDNTLASGSLDGTIRVWNAASLEGVSTLPGHSRQIRSLSFSPDGLFLASSAGDETEEGFPLEPGEVTLWNVKRRSKIASLPGLTNSVRSVAFSPVGKILAVGAPYSVELWDPLSLHKVGSLWHRTKS